MASIDKLLYIYGTISILCIGILAFANTKYYEWADAKKPKHKCQCSCWQAPALFENPYELTDWKSFAVQTENK